MELCPEGTKEPREGPEKGKRLGSQTSLLPSPRMRPYPSASAPAASGLFLPWSPGPHASPAHRGSGLRPPRAPSAAPLRKHLRRHLPLAAVTLRTRRTCMVAGKWSPRSRPTPAPTALPAAFRPAPDYYSRRLFVSGLWARCLLGSVVLGLRLGTGSETEASGKWSSQWFSVPGRLVLERLESTRSEASRSWRWFVALVGS